MVYVRLLVPLLLVVTPAAAQEELPPRPKGMAEIAYGSDPRHRLDFLGAKRGAPLVVFIHGGWWMGGDKGTAAEMATRIRARGYAFAALNYRLVPNVTVDRQAEDVAAGLARLIRGAKQLGFDRRRIVLVGHSAGAHLAALITTDPRYLAAHKLSPTLVDGVVLLDSAGYDVPKKIRESTPEVRDNYLKIFGRDADYQNLVSPVTHGAAPNARRYLLLSISSRTNDSGAQAKRLGAALQAAKADVAYAVVDDTHMGVFSDFGKVDHAATTEVESFIDRVFSAAS